MDADIYLSPFGKSRTSKEKKIKTFAVHKGACSPRVSQPNFLPSPTQDILPPSLLTCPVVGDSKNILKRSSPENSKSDYVVVAANDSSEISVRFNGGSDCKVFSFHKVLCDDESQVVLYDSLLKSIVQDVMMGLNSFLILCNLKFYDMNLDSKHLFHGMLPTNSLLKNILKELLMYTTKEENINSSLHASFFEVHDDRIVDLLNKNNEIVDFKTLKVFRQNYTEIKDLTEKPIVNEKDVADIFTNQFNSLFCNSSICHSIFTASLVEKSESCNDFESMKVGKLFVVDFAKCKGNILGANIYADCDLKIPENTKFAASSKNQLFDILKPAFGGSARTIVVASISSYLFYPERDLSILQFIAELQNVCNYPEINIKRIIPTSLRELSEEIQELQRDLNAINQKKGVTVEPALYRYFKNSATVENEKLKILRHHLSSLRESNNSKKQKLIGMHSASQQIGNEITEEEKQLETLRLELKKLQGQNDIKQKSSIQAYEILKMKQEINTNIFNLEKLKSNLAKIHFDYNELTHSLKSLNADMVSIAFNMESEKSFVKKTLVSLVNDMQSSLPELQTQHNDLMMKLNSLSAVDVLFDTWKKNTEMLLGKFSNFTEEQRKIFDSFNFKRLSPIMPLQTLESEVVKIIENNKAENSPVLFSLVSRIEVLSSSLHKTLSEIFSILDAIQKYYKNELMTLGSILSSSCKTFKKFFDDIGSVLKLSQQYSEAFQGEAKIADLVFFHHKFKKEFDSQLNDIKHSVLMLKQSCLNHNDSAISKWNEVQKSCHKTSQKHSDISNNLSLIKKQMSLHLNQDLKKMTLFNCLQLKEEAKNAMKKTQLLLQIQEDMGAIFATATEIENREVDKEMQEVKKYTDSQKTEVEKCFNDHYAKMKMNFDSFLNDLQTLFNAFSNNEDEIEKNFSVLSSSASSLTAFYDNYWAVLENVYGKTASALKKLPTTVNVTVDRSEDMSGSEIIYIDDWTVISSTPKVAEVKHIDMEFEKEKLLERIRNDVEQQMSKKLNVGGLDNEGKEENNLSTMSLPNFGSSRSILYKASQTSENVFKAKSSRK